MLLADAFASPHSSRLTAAHGLMKEWLEAEAQMPPEIATMMRQKVNGTYRDQVKVICTALQAGGRGQEAQAVLRRAIELVPSAELTELVKN